MLAHFMRLMCANAQGCPGFSCAQENESGLALLGVVAYGIRSKKWLESNAARLSSGQPPRSRPTSCPGAWASLRRKFPDIQVSVVEELTSELLERVLDGTLDLALLALPIPGGHFVCQELFRERLHLVVPENHRLSSHSMVHLKQVERDPFLLFKDGHCFRENTLSACGRARLRPNVVFESGQFTTILAMVGGGTGVSVVPQMAVERRKGCRFISIADEEAYRRVGIVQLKQHFRSRAHSTFLRHLQ
jgi:LysR family transcriptional regulator, hydrogen peroxide-inducible genes activator